MGKGQDPQTPLPPASALFPTSTDPSRHMAHLGRCRTLLGRGVPGCQRASLSSLSRPNTQDSSVTCVSPLVWRLPLPTAWLKAAGELRAGDDAVPLPRQPRTPQQYLSSLMPAVAPR